MIDENRLCKQVDKRISNIKNKDVQLYAGVHLYSVATSARMFAYRRRLNPQLLFCSGLLHDLWSFENNIEENHARMGSEFAREFLKNVMNLENDDISKISVAIFYHSSKDMINSKFDEALKDADVLQHYLLEPNKEYENIKIKRLKKISSELGLNLRIKYN